MELLARIAQVIVPVLFIVAAGCFRVAAMILPGHALAVRFVPLGLALAP